MNVNQLKQIMKARGNSFKAEKRDSLSMSLYTQFK